MDSSHLFVLCSIHTAAETLADLIRLTHISTENKKSTPYGIAKEKLSLISGCLSHTSLHVQFSARTPCHSCLPLLQAK